LSSREETVLAALSAALGDIPHFGGSAGDDNYLHHTHVYFDGAFHSSAAVVLLVAIVAAVALTLRKRKDTKHFAPGDAVRVKRNDRLKIIKMDAVVERPAAEPEVKEAP